MFSWNIHSTWNATQFTLTVPLHQIMLLMSVLGAFVLLLLGLKAGRSLRNIGIIVGLLLAFGFLCKSTEVTFDRVSGTATIRDFQFYHWSTHVYPLQDVDRVLVSTGSTTSQLNLQFVDGSIETLDFLDQTGGKTQVAYAANKWLRGSE